jgi:tRNA 2-thiouridine synthesizing protein A
MTRTLDVRGLRCPIPAIRARRALAGVPADEALTVLTTDPEAPIDLAALAADAGRACAVQRDADGWRIVLGPRSGAPAAPGA